MNATIASSDCARRKNPLSGYGAVWSGGQKREDFPVGMGGATLEPDRARRRKTGGRHFSILETRFRQATRKKQNAKRKPPVIRPACHVSASFYVGSFNPS